MSGALDTADTLDRLISQTRAVTVALLGNGAHRHMNPEVVSNLIWLVYDRLGDIEKAVNAANFAD